MAVYTQIAQIVAKLVEQATGVKVYTPVNYSEFVTVGQMALKAGWNNIIPAISDVMAGTVFSIRPYTRKFKGLDVDGQKFGDMVRKLSMVDPRVQDNPAVDGTVLVDGATVDPWRIYKENVLQLNFYGFNSFMVPVTHWGKQLNSSFMNPAELQRYLTMKTQNAIDYQEQLREEIARGVIANLILATFESSNDKPYRAINLTIEYNQYAGTALTMDEILSPDNVGNFGRWFFERFAEIVTMMGERGQNMCTTITGKPVNRHTPLRDMKVYMLSSFMGLLDATVRTTTFHNEYLKFVDYEKVGYWVNSAHDRGKISGTFAYTDTSGNLVTKERTVPINVVGLIFDRDAAGITNVDRHVENSPWNGLGEYMNTFYKSVERYWNDTTENSVVLYFGADPTARNTAPAVNVASVNPSKIVTDLGSTKSSRAIKAKIEKGGKY